MIYLQEAYENGKIPESALGKIDTGQPLEKNAAEAYMRMKNDAKKDGVDIKLTGPSSGYRECGEPGDYTQGKSGGKFTQWYAWELYKAGKGNLAANPTKGKCTSNHGLGKAIDVSGSAAKKWIKNNGVKYGWVWYTKDGGEGERIGENWHFIYNSDKVDNSAINKDVNNTTNTQSVDTKSTNTTVDANTTTETVPVILMAGLNYRKGDKSTEEQGGLLRTGLGGITDVIAKDYDDLSGVKKEIDKSPNSPIVLFSAGGSKAKQISKYVIEKGGDPNNIFISEPYTKDSGVKDNVEAAIANGVPRSNIIGGPDESNITGKNVAGVFRKDMGGKSHWDGLKVAGQLVKEKLGSLLGQKTKIDNTSTNTSTNTQSLETQTTYTTKPKEMPSWKKKVFSVLDKLEENQKLNEEVYRIKDLIKKIL